MTDSAAVPRTIQSDIAAPQWLSLAHTPAEGPIRGHRLGQNFSRVERVFQALLTELETAERPAVSAQSIALGKSYSAAEKELMKARDVGAEIIAFQDARYPDPLKRIYDPPLALYVRGDFSILSCPELGVVGTRHPTPYGVGMAERCSTDLASRGLLIVSGMARGVDTDAHCGALVSEFAIGTFTAPQNFPIQNRIISSLSLGVLVVEAGEYSGIRITARCALEQDREIFAVPDKVTNRNSWGPNTLIMQGAKPTATREDVCEELPAELELQLEAGWRVESTKPVEASLCANSQLSPHEKRRVRAAEAGRSRPARPNHRTIGGRDFVIRDFLCFV